MALVKCPECGKEISEHAQACPNCGFPIDKIAKEEAKMYAEMDIKCPVCTHTNKKEDLNSNNMRCCLCGADLSNVEKLQEEIQELQRQRNMEEQQSKLSNQVHCPYCNSPNVKRISATKKATSIIGFGILSNKIGKQWHCNNCRSDF